jgi:hypothetical protein
MNMKILAIVVSVVVLAAVVTAFVVIGSPAHQRQLKLDSQRVSDLQSIQNQILNYWQQKESLPNNLAALNDSISGFKAPVDPQTNTPYEYVVQTTLNFQLCANFSLPSEANDPRTNPMPYLGSENWSHGSGRVCFDRTIDPELYKPRSLIK